MTWITEAIYTQGVLKLLDRLDLPEQQCVRLIVEPIDGAGAGDCAAALDRLRSGIEQMNFRSHGPLPSRDELHDRP